MQKLPIRYDFHGKTEVVCFSQGGFMTLSNRDQDVGTYGAHQLCT